MIDNNGYRPNVGIMLSNGKGQLLWARRIKSVDSWQFPQGGIKSGETPEEALYRELYEEIGLNAKDVKINIVDSALAELPFTQTPGQTTSMASLYRPKTKVVSAAINLQ